MRVLGRRGLTGLVAVPVLLALALPASAGASGDEEAAGPSVGGPGVVEVTDVCGAPGTPSPQWPLPEPAAPWLDVCAVRAVPDRDEQGRLRALDLQMDLLGAHQRTVDVGYVQFRWSTAGCLAMLAITLRDRAEAGPDEVLLQLDCPEDRFTTASLRPDEVLTTSGHRLTVHLDPEVHWTVSREPFRSALDPAAWEPQSLALFHGVNTNAPYATTLRSSVDRVGETPSYACTGGGGNLWFVVRRYAPALCDA